MIHLVPTSINSIARHLRVKNVDLVNKLSLCIYVGPFESVPSLLPRPPMKSMAVFWNAVAPAESVTCQYPRIIDQHMAVLFGLAMPQ